MWYPATVTVAASAEPVTIEQAREWCHVEAGDSDHDGALNALIAGGRSHVEGYTSTRLASQTVAVKCDSFADMERLPEAPVTSVSSITYVDADGATQTLSADVYEVRADGFETAIVLKYAQAWPSMQPGSRITMTAVVGYASVPAAVLLALRMFIADGFAQRENAAVNGRSIIDDLLANHRR